MESSKIDLFDYEIFVLELFSGLFGNDTPNKDNVFDDTLHQELSKFQLKIFHDEYLARKILALSLFYHLELVIEEGFSRSSLVDAIENYNELGDISVLEKYKSELKHDFEKLQASFDFDQIHDLRFAKENSFFNSLKFLDLFVSTVNSYEYKKFSWVFNKRENVDQILICHDVKRLDLNKIFNTKLFYEIVLNRIYFYVIDNILLEYYAEIKYKKRTELPSFKIEQKGFFKGFEEETVTILNEFIEKHSDKSEAFFSRFYFLIIFSELSYKYNLDDSDKLRKKYKDQIKREYNFKRFRLRDNYSEREMKKDSKNIEQFLKSKGLELRDL